MHTADKSCLYPQHTLQTLLDQNILDVLLGVEVWLVQGTIVYSIFRMDLARRCATFSSCEILYSIIVAKSSPVAALIRTWRSWRTRH